MRHELEHVRQHEACGDGSLQLHKLAAIAIARENDGAIPNRLLNQSPIELDANAAAAGYLRRHHPAHLAAIGSLERNGNLAQAIEPPQPLENLIERMTRFLLCYRAGLERELGSSVSDYVGDYDPEAAKTWESLTRSTE